MYNHYVATADGYAPVFAGAGWGVVETILLTPPFPANHVVL